MAITVSQITNEMADREAIRDCLYRYARGVDRGNAELLRSVYWPGAMDYHTGFTGTAEEFIEWAMPRMAQMEQNVHMMGNSLIRIDGDNARAETYLWSVSVVPGDDPRQIMVTGRYLDKFEKRKDEWRIAERTVVHDWFNESSEVGDWSVGPFGMSGLLRGGLREKDPSDGWF